MRKGHFDFRNKNYYRIGYVAQHLKARGRQVKTAIGLDPAGPGYVVIL